MPLAHKACHHIIHGRIIHVSCRLIGDSAALSTLSPTVATKLLSQIMTADLFVEKSTPQFAVKAKTEYFFVV